MAINPSAIASQSVTDQNTGTVIEMLATQPSTSSTFSPARPPGQLCGFYNGAIDGVELYVVNGAGIRFRRVV